MNKYKIQYASLALATQRALHSSVPVLKGLAAKGTYYNCSVRQLLVSRCQCIGKCRSLFMENMKSNEKDAEKRNE